MAQSTHESPRAKKFLQLSLVFLLLVLIVGLYGVAGLPRPWASATRRAHEIAAFQKFSAVARVIQHVGEGGTTAQFMSALEDAGASFNGNEGDFEGEKLFLREKTGSCDTVVVGLGRDENGMVWAVTRRGEVLKVLP